VASKTHVFLKINKIKVKKNLNKKKMKINKKKFLLKGEYNYNKNSN
jgi:hypothetical protein